MKRFFGIMPGWLLLLTGFLLVTLLGYIDYLTGDYSILVFYLIPIALEAWYLGRWGGVAMAVASGVARVVSDYASYNNTSLRYWNSAEDMIFMLVVALLISTIKNQLGRE
jgi:hypothetical protein